MDFEKLESISQELAKTEFKKVDNPKTVTLILGVYAGDYTTEQAKQIINYLEGGNKMECEVIYNVVKADGSKMRLNINDMVTMTINLNGQPTTMTGRIALLSSPYSFGFDVSTPYNSNSMLYNYCDLISIDFAK